MRAGARGRIRSILWVVLFVLYVLHNDLWYWNDPRFVLGLPVGLAYHVGYMVAVAGLMFVLARYAWPTRLEIDEGGGAAGAGDGVAEGRTAAPGGSRRTGEPGGGGRLGVPR